MRAHRRSRLAPVRPAAVVALLVALAGFAPVGSVRRHAPAGAAATWPHAPAGAVTPGRSHAPAGASLLPPAVYEPPVDAEVLDPFRPPPEPWLAGNRGIEYATVPGTPVRTIGPGVVVFAGPVAGQVWVTVLHGDGLRSSYGVAAAWVRRGQRLRAGAVIGVAGSSLHLGVRRGSTYLDPASLWGRRVGPGIVALVPLIPGFGATLGGGGPPR